MLVAFLQANADVFAWEPSQMPGIPKEVIEHCLKINPNARPMSQKPRRQSVERQDFNAKIANRNDIQTTNRLQFTVAGL